MRLELLQSALDGPFANGQLCRHGVERWPRRLFPVCMPTQRYVHARRIDAASLGIAIQVKVIDLKFLLVSQIAYFDLFHTIAF